MRTTIGTACFMYLLNSCSSQCGGRIEALRMAEEITAQARAQH